MAYDTQRNTFKKKIQKINEKLIKHATNEAYL